MLFKVVWRNILRNKRRTALTVSMMVFGQVLFSFFLALSEGGYGNIINQFIDARTGEIQIHFEDYLDDPKTYKAISHYEKTLELLSAKDEVVSVTPRIRGNALGFFKKKTMGIQVVGFDVDGEKRSTNFNERVTKGSIPISNDAYAVVIGRKVAQILKIGLGDDLVLISSGADGSIANDKFKVSGIIDQGSAGQDDMLVYIPISAAQEFFSLWGRIHEIVVRTKERPTAEIVQAVSAGLEKNLTLSTWKEIEKDFYKAMLADRKGDRVARFIIILVVAIGVFNTILMSILERTKELGVLKAIGTKPSFLFQMITLESLLLGSISVLVSIILSFGVNTYFSIYGISFEKPIEYGGFTFSEMNTIVNLDTFLIPSSVILLTAFVVSIVPAIKAAKVVPVEAMRS